MKRVAVSLALLLAAGTWETSQGEGLPAGRGNPGVGAEGGAAGRIPAVRRPLQAPSNPQPPSGQSTPRASTPLSDWTGSRAVHINLSRPAARGDNNQQPFQINSPAQDDFPVFHPGTGQPEEEAPASQPGAAPAPHPPSRGNVAHHHLLYTPGYVRKKFRKIGVTRIPYPIEDRSHMLDTDRTRSILKNLPVRGPGGRPLAAVRVLSRQFNDAVVRNQMESVNDPSVSARVLAPAKTETRPNHFYWHELKGADYCHLVDPWGYQWYGWYVGNRYFWTRYFADRWWWYDADYGRWCFWNDGWWWWQDPYHVGDLYLYDENQYIPCNSANDRVVVTTVEPANPTLYRSPDGTRVVKVMGQDRDAFLCDTAIPPSFNPVYLASQVKGAKYSEGDGEGKPRVTLTLGDGSVNLFDGEGNPMDFSEGAVETDGN